MATWSFAKSSWFGETSTELGRMWCQLPPNEKKVYEKMAKKDNARFQRQCRQFMESRSWYCEMADHEDNRKMWMISA
ncbi:hypothetical protein ACFX2F_001616 [Malus domestica]